VENNISTEDFEWAYSKIRALIAELKKVIAGKDYAIELLVSALIAGGHILLEDVPGTGKTTMSLALSKAIGGVFKRASFNPDVTPSDITGFTILNRKTNDFEYREGLVMTNILLADEINRASPKTQSSLLEVMEESRVTVDGTTYPLPEPFMVIATQNPMGFIGTNPLPEAQLDRFMLKLSMGYPSPQQEARIIMERQYQNPIELVNEAVSIDEVKKIQRIVKNIFVDSVIGEYIVKLVAATRSQGDIALGASPRASLSLFKLSQARALLNGRDYVLPQDVKEMFPYAAEHRISLKNQAKLNNITVAKILQDISGSVLPPLKTKTR